MSEVRLQRRGPLDDESRHPMLEAAQPAGIAVVHGARPTPASTRIELSIGPDRWLLVSEETPVTDGADLGHGLVRIRVSGPSASELLASGTSVDLDPSVFGEGAATATAYRGVPIVVHASAAGTMDVYCPRSYAVSLWEWLTDAADGLP